MQGEEAGDGVSVGTVQAKMQSAGCWAAVQPAAAASKAFSSPKLGVSSSSSSRSFTAKVALTSCRRLNFSSKDGLVLQFSCQLMRAAGPLA